MTPALFFGILRGGILVTVGAVPVHFRGVVFWFDVGFGRHGFCTTRDERLWLTSAHTIFDVHVSMFGSMSPVDARSVVALLHSAWACWCIAYPRIP
jgi:hypothetical protein